MITSQYISDDQFQAILDDLNITDKDDAQQQELLDRAVADLEADLSERFVVPLIGAGFTPYTSAPAFARNKVINALKSKIRQLIGRDNNRNLVIESTERYVDVHKLAYQDDVKSLLNPKIMYGFQLQEYAQGAVVPVQKLGLARADNELEVEVDPMPPFLSL